MTYKPSPRPTFSGPTHLHYGEVVRHVWGDSEAGNVADRIYVSSDKIHQLVWSLEPGEAFRHSSEFRTIFGADVIYYVLSGTMVISNPETGEVHRVLPGEAALLRKDTWHHAFNHGQETLHVLEYFAPPPSQGTSGAYARTRPLLTETRYGIDSALGHWPMERAAIEQRFTIRIIREQNLLWRLEGGRGNEVLHGLFCSTEHLTMAKVILQAGQCGELHKHAGDESLFLLEGTLHVNCPDSEGQQWNELEPQDGYYLPEGTVHAYHNKTDKAVTFIVGVSPAFLP